MDINSRINWTNGMEMTAQTLLGLNDQWDSNLQLALRASLGSNRMGLLPNTPFECKAAFAAGQLEVEELRCTALLPSGRVVDANENVHVQVPMLFGDVYYLTVSFSDYSRTFEREGVSFIKPRYNYNINSREEIEDGDLFPLLRFHVKDNTMTLDSDYIVPCLILKDDSRFKDYIDGIADRLTKLATHVNMAEGECKRSLLRYMFELKGYSLQTSAHEFMKLTQEIAQAIDFYIMTPNKEEAPQVLLPSLIDLQEWLGWLNDYLDGAATVLDSVTLAPPIDYEALLAQAKAELYERLNPELTQRMLEALKEELQGEIQQLNDNLTNYINQTVKEELKNELTTTINERLDQINEQLNEKTDQMGRELHESLYEKLYQELFDHLFNALYVPEPEEKKFIPII